MIVPTEDWRGHYMRWEVEVTGGSASGCSLVINFVDVSYRASSSPCDSATYFNRQMRDAACLSNHRSELGSSAWVIRHSCLVLLHHCSAIQGCNDDHSNAFSFSFSALLARRSYCDQCALLHNRENNPRKQSRGAFFTALLPGLIDSRARWVGPNPKDPGSSSCCRV